MKANFEVLNIHTATFVEIYSMLHWFIKKSKTLIKQNSTKHIILIKI